MREAFEESGSLEGLKAASVSKKLFKTALRVCRQRTRDLNELIDDPNGFDALVSDNDWRILGANELNEEALAVKKHTDWMKKQERLA